MMQHLDLQPEEHDAQHRREEAWPALTALAASISPSQDNPSLGTAQLSHRKRTIYGRQGWNPRV